MTILLKLRKLELNNFIYMSQRNEGCNCNFKIFYGLLNQLELELFLIKPPKI